MACVWGDERCSEEQGCQEGEENAGVGGERAIEGLSYVGVQPGVWVGLDEELRVGEGGLGGDLLDVEDYRVLLALLRVELAEPAGDGFAGKECGFQDLGGVCGRGLAVAVDGPIDGGVRADLALGRAFEEELEGSVFGGGEWGDVEAAGPLRDGLGDWGPGADVFLRRPGEVEQGR